MKTIIILCVLVGVVWKSYDYFHKVSLGPGIMAKEDPLQTTIDRPVTHFVGNYTFTEVAKFHIKAKLLSKSYYNFDRVSGIAPVDFALGWGKMSDESTLEHFGISQGFRNAMIRETSPSSISQDELKTHIANVHIIPVNDSVRSAVDKVKEGEIVELSGSLVNVLSSDGSFEWNSSLTRHDVGDKACEIMWVKDIKVINY